MSRTRYNGTTDAKWSRDLVASVGERSLAIRWRDDERVVPLSRDAEGRVDAESAERVRETLESLLARRSGSEPFLCAVPDRGATIREFHLPARVTSELDLALALQLEAEFPVPVEELVWWYYADFDRRNGTGVVPVSVVALRRALVRDVERLFSGLTLAPALVPAFMASQWGIPARWGRASSDPNGAVLDVRDDAATFTLYRGGSPSLVRRWPITGPADPEQVGARLAARVEGEIAVAVAQAAKRVPVAILAPPALEESVRDALSSSPWVEVPEADRRDGSEHGRVLEGLRALASAPVDRRPRRGVRRVAGPRRQRRATRPRVAPWLIAALLAWIGWAVATHWRPITELEALRSEVAALEADVVTGSASVSELAFLRDLEHSRRESEFLDTLTLLARDAPPGVRVDGIGLSESRELRVEGRATRAEDANRLRSALASSGLVRDATLQIFEGDPVRFHLFAWVREGARLPGSTPAGGAEPAARRDVDRGDGP